MNASLKHGCALDAESFGPDLDLDALRACAARWNWHDRTEPHQTADRLADAEVVITNKVRLGETEFAAAPNLALVCIAATGVDNVDLAAAERHGVTVCNATGYATASVVQHTFALLLALATRIEDYAAAARDGRWAAHSQFCLLDYPIVELDGRSLGIVGYGTLGRAVADTARAFGMEVLIAARPGSKTVPEGRVALTDMLARADVVSLHCPLTPATRGLIDAEALRRMRPGALLINTARGGIVDEAALAAALRDGEIAGAGIDVLTEEPPRHGNVLLDAQLPNLIVTPHCAWGTRAARQRLIDRIVDNIEAWVAGTPRNVVAGGHA